MSFRAKRAKGRIAPGSPTPTPSPAASIYPSATWNGTPASGWTTEPTPSGVDGGFLDPTSRRMSAAAVIANFVNIPYYYGPIITDEFIYVKAASKGGITKVTFDCEGRTVDVTTPTFETVTFGGRSYSDYFYKIKVDHALFSGNGRFKVYATIVSADGAYADRTIGPLMHDRRTGSQFKEIRIRPSGSDTIGAVYCGPTAIQKAYNWYYSNGNSDANRHIWLWTDEAFTHDLVTAGAFNFNVDNGGTFLIKPKPGGSISCLKSTQGFDTLYTRVNGTVWEKCSFDTRYMTTWKLTEHRPMIFLDNDLTCSGGASAQGTGRVEMTGRTGIDTGANAARTGRNNAFMGSSAANGCHWSYANRYTNMIQGPNSSARSVLDTFTNISSDHHNWTNPLASLILASLSIDHSCEYERTTLPAISIYYDGAGTPTYSVGGTADNGNESSDPARTLTLLVNGSTTGGAVLTASSTPGTGLHTYTHVAAAINALAGWHATLLTGHDERRFATLLGTATASGASVSKLVGAPTVLGGWLDIHADWLQNGDAAVNDNCMMAGCEYRSDYITAGGDAIQTLFLKNVNGMLRNSLIENNSAKMGPDGTPAVLAQSNGTMYGKFSHVLIRHNSIPNQAMDFSLDQSAQTTDAKCEFRGNVFGKFLFNPGDTPAGSPGSMEFKDNHAVQTGGAFAANWADNGGTRTGNTTGSSVIALFPGWAADNLAPGGTLLSGLAARTSLVDRKGVLRAATTPKGALAA